MAVHAEYISSKTKKLTFFFFHCFFAPFFMLWEDGGVCEVTKVGFLFSLILISSLLNYDTHTSVEITIIFVIFPIKRRKG